MTWLTICLFFLGLVLVVAGSNYLVDGASDIARRSGLSEFLIGLTIVGIGTSTPEMVVSFIGAIEGSSDISIGNIVGSNIFNTFLILGLTAVILPMQVSGKALRRDIPLNALICILLIFMLMKKDIFGIGENSISRIEGGVLLLLFALYMYKSFKDGRNEASLEDSSQEVKRYKYLITPILLVLGGLAGLIFGGQLFVDNAVVIARHMGWSDKLIGITILAGGTSMPELATCVVAAFKKKGQLALGNIIGSNISNILLILGGAALIRPLGAGGINFVDLGFMTLSALFILASAFTFKKYQLDRIEGAMMLICEAAYMYILITA